MEMNKISRQRRQQQQRGANTIFFVYLLSFSHASSLDVILSFLFCAIPTILQQKLLPCLFDARGYF